jgi:Arc/MetJ-type ribon-helix-helix transcriptional regulator
MPITLTLTPDQEAILAAAVARGEFASTEEAAKAVVFRGMSAIEGPSIEDDPEQVELLKEALDEARAQVARGEYFTLEETLARMDQRRSARHAR